MSLARSTSVRAHRNLAHGATAKSDDAAGRSARSAPPFAVSTPRSDAPQPSAPAGALLSTRTAEANTSAGMTPSVTTMKEYSDLSTSESLPTRFGEPSQGLAAAAPRATRRSVVGGIGADDDGAVRLA